MIDKISRYEIERELGRGGMATVYLAHDPQFGRKVALKVLPKELAHDVSFQQRFKREAQTIANLEHNAIVPVYDFGEENGRLFLVMRLMTGGTLADKLTKRRLSLTEVETLLKEIASALDKSHSLGLVHRDLKPANILYDNDGRPYLSDFGIVKVSEGQTLTSSGSLIGTPAYISPEQAKGDVVLDGRADIYSLGIILYQTLSGQPPYQADTAMGLILAHLQTPVPLLPISQLGLPAGIAAVVAKAMAKDRNQRYLTAGQLAAAFSSAIQGQSEPSWQQTIIESPTLPPNRPITPPPIRPPTIPPTPIPNQPTSAQPKQDELPRNPLLWWVGGGMVFALGLLLVFGLLAAGSLLNRSTPEPTQLVIVVVATDEEAATPEVIPAHIEPTVSEPVSPTPPPPTATETAVPTNTPSPTVTPPPITAFIPMGQSTAGTPLTIIRVGYGPQRVVIIGGIHGDEPDTVAVVRGLSDYFYDHVERVPAGATFYFLPALNPDGLTEDDRFTPGGVDLNRNWDTPSWLQDSPQPSGIMTNSGGAFPFSEPETATLSNFLLDLQADPATEHLLVIFYHHHTGVADTGQVQPGYESYGNPAGTSSEMAVAMANAGGYQYVPFWNGPYQPSGEAINWCALQQIAAVDVELPPEGGPDERPAGQTRTILQAAIESILALVE